MAARRTVPARRPAAGNRAAPARATKASRKRPPPKKPAEPRFVGKYLAAKGKVSSKGWVVIPKEIRDEMGIKPGDEVRFSLWPPSLMMKQDRELYSLHLHKMPADPVALGYGLFPRRPGEPSLTEELVREHRLEVEQEEREIREHRQRRKTSA